MQHLRIGTRGSPLALVQTEFVANYLRYQGWDVEIRVITTLGDRLADVPVEQIPERGIFVSALEQALLSGEIDLAVHSLKDLPGQATTGLVLAAIPAREDPRDVLIGRTAPTLETLPAGAVIGTSSQRRRAELLRMRPDILVVDMRGNIDSRVRKLDEEQYDAICLAAAGLHRIGLGDRITQYFDPAALTPAPGQGALAVQTRADHYELISLLEGLHDLLTGEATQIERYVLAAIGGGCTSPVGVYVQRKSTGYAVLAAYYSSAGDILSRFSVEMEVGDPQEVGRRIVVLLQRQKA